MVIMQMSNRALLSMMILLSGVSCTENENGSISQTPIMSPEVDEPESSPQTLDAVPQTLDGAPLTVDSEPQKSAHLQEPLQVSELLGRSRADVELGRVVTKKIGRWTFYGTKLAARYDQDEVGELRYLLDEPATTCTKASKIVGFTSPGPSERTREGESECEATPGQLGVLRAKTLRIRPAAPPPIIVEATALELQPGLIGCGRIMEIGYVWFRVDRRLSGDPPPEVSDRIRVVTQCPRTTGLNHRFRLVLHRHQPRAGTLGVKTLAKVVPEDGEPTYWSTSKRYIGKSLPSR